MKKMGFRVVNGGEIEYMVVMVVSFFRVVLYNLNHP